MSLFKRREWTESKVSMLTDYSSGEFPVYHRIMSDEFKKQGITLASRDLLPRKQYFDEQSGYGKVRVRGFNVKICTNLVCDKVAKF